MVWVYHYHVLNLLSLLVASFQFWCAIQAIQRFRKAPQRGYPWLMHPLFWGGANAWLGLFNFLSAMFSFTT